MPGPKPGRRLSLAGKVPSPNDEVPSRGATGAGEPGQARKGAAVARSRRVHGVAGRREGKDKPSQPGGSTPGRSARIYSAIIVLGVFVLILPLFALLSERSVGCAEFPVIGVGGWKTGKVCAIPFRGVFFPPGTDSGIVSGARDAYTVLIQRVPCKSGFLVSVPGTGRSATLAIYAAMYALCRGKRIRIAITGDMDPHGNLIPVSLEGKCGQATTLYAPAGSQPRCQNVRYVDSIEEVEALVDR